VQLVGFGSGAPLGLGKRGLLGGEVVIVGEVGPLDVLLSGEAASEGFAGLQEVLQIEVEVRLFQLLLGTRHLQILRLDLLLLGRLLVSQQLLLIED
jgi:hypothetical protein